MKNPWTLLVMSRYLLGQGPTRSGGLKRIRGAIVGIALSLVPLLMVYQVAEGMIEGISARFLETGTFHLQARFPGDFEILPEAGRDGSWGQTIADIRRQDGVVWAGEEVQGMLLGASDTASLGLMVRAVDPSLVQDPGFSRYIQVQEGSLDVSGPDTVVLGREAARLLGVGAGDSIRLLSLRTDAAAFIPKVSRLRVAGVISSGYQELDKLWCFVNLERGKRLLPPETMDRFIAIKVDQPQTLPNPLFASGGSGTGGVFARVRSVLGFSWTIHTWYELQKNEYLSFVTTRNLLMFIMFLIVLIASVNVSSAMIMMVLEKQHEIAILKSMGAGPGSIVAIFMGAGGISGGLGALVGLSAGAVLSLFVNEIIHGFEWLLNAAGAVFQALANPGASYQELAIFNPAFYLERIPIRLNPGVIAAIFGLTIVLSLAASWFPARKAARLRPLEIMRKV